MYIYHNRKYCSGKNHPFAPVEEETDFTQKIRCSGAGKAKFTSSSEITYSFIRETHKK